MSVPDLPLLAERMHQHVKGRNFRRKTVPKDLRIERPSGGRGIRGHQTLKQAGTRTQWQRETVLASEPKALNGVPNEAEFSVGSDEEGEEGGRGR